MHLAPAINLSILLLAAAAVLLVVLLVALGRWPGGRLDQRRTVLVHVSLARAWSLAGPLSVLHSKHGKLRDFGHIDDWTLSCGDGEEEGSIWRAQGAWGDEPYWADIEIVRVVPGKKRAVRLRRDSLGTEKGLRDHLATLTLEAIGPDATKLTWRLRARLRSPGLVYARLVSSGALRARLLDLGLRSLKIEMDGAAQQWDGTRSAPSPIHPPAAPTPERLPPETTV